MHFLTKFFYFHFLKGLFIGICIFLSTLFNIESSNFVSAHLLWIYNKWYLNFVLLLSYGPFLIFLMAVISHASSWSLVFIYNYGATEEKLKQLGGRNILKTFTTLFR